MNPRHPDARSGLVIEVHELGRRPGAMKALQLAAPAPADLGIDMIGVPQGSTIDLDLKLEAVVEGVLVTGTASVDLVGECARCLEEMSTRQTFSLQELYYYPGRDAEEDANWVDNEMIDLEPALREAVVLELPFSPLCRSDCEGLCQECGANLNLNPDHTHGEPIDPRWGQLAELAEEN